MPFYQEHPCGSHSVGKELPFPLEADLTGSPLDLLSESERLAGSSQLLPQWPLLLHSEDNGVLDQCVAGLVLLLGAVAWEGDRDPFWNTGRGTPDAWDCLVSLRSGQGVLAPQGSPPGLLGCSVSGF